MRCSPGEPSISRTVWLHAVWSTPRHVGISLGLVLFSLLIPAIGEASQRQDSLSGTTGDSGATFEERANAAFELGTPEGLDRAAELFEAAANAYEGASGQAKAGEMLANAGYVHNVRGRADSAFTSYRRSLRLVRAAGDRATEALALGDVGELHHRLGQLDSAVVYYEDGLALVRELDDPGSLGRMLNNLGIAHHDLGVLDAAASYLAEALAIRRELGDGPGEAVTLNNLAQIQLTLGRPDSAIVLQRSSLEIRRELSDLPAVGTVLNNLGLAFSRLQQPDSSLAYYREALEIWREFERPAVLSLTLSNLGRAHRAVGALDSALVYTQEGLNLARELGDRASEVWALMDLGLTYVEARQPDDALAALQGGLEAAREVGDRAREGEILFHLAQVYHRVVPDPELERAVAYYDSASVARSRVAERAGGEENRVSFAEQDVRLFEEWTLAWLAREDISGAEFAALSAAERGRAQGLLDLMRAEGRRGGPDPVVDGIPLAGTLQPGADLLSEGRALAMAARGAGTGILYYLATEDTLVSWLVRPEGGLRTHRTAVSLDSLAAWVRYLRTGLGVDDGAGVALRGGTELEPRPVPPGPARRDTDYSASLASTLADLLLPPSFASDLRNGQEIVVGPQGPLNLLPFAVLPLGDKNRLVEPFGSEFPIRYAPSLAALVEAERRPALELPEPGSDSGVALQRLSGALIVGNPVMPEVRNGMGDPVVLAALPGSEEEARSIGDLLGASPLLGAEATEAEVRARMRDAPIVHLATHGYAYASEERARDSFMALSPGLGHDGLLTVGEILRDPELGLEAELVVLSACQTGLGDVKRAEGTVGFQRAFLARGARSVLVSLWSVSDLVTKEIMQAFYTHWLQDEDRPLKAEALHRAQEDVRAVAGLEHPRFWGAFQLVGAR